MKPHPYDPERHGSKEEYREMIQKMEQRWRQEAKEQEARVIKERERMMIDKYARGRGEENPNTAQARGLVEGVPNTTTARGLVPELTIVSDGVKDQKAWVAANPGKFSPWIHKSNYPGGIVPPRTLPGQTRPTQKDPSPSLPPRVPVTQPNWMDKPLADIGPMPPPARAQYDRYQEQLQAQTDARRSAETAGVRKPTSSIQEYLKIRQQQQPRQRRRRPQYQRRPPISRNQLGIRHPLNL